MHQTSTSKINLVDSTIKYFPEYAEYLNQIRFGQNILC